MIHCCFMHQMSPPVTRRGNVKMLFVVFMYILRHFKLIDVVFLFSVDFMGLVMEKICQCFRFLLSISVHYRWVLYDFACKKLT